MAFAKLRERERERRAARDAGAFARFDALGHIYRRSLCGLPSRADTPAGNYCLVIHAESGTVSVVPQRARAYRDLNLLVERRAG